MIGLYFLYIVALQSTAALRFQDTRIVPFALMAWMVQPAVYSVIDLVLLGGTLRQPIDPEYPNFYTRVDAWFYVSLAIALLLSWIAFDRRRVLIQKRLPNLQETRVFRYRFIILSSQLAFIFLLNYLRHISPWYCLFGFAIGVGFLSVMAWQATKHDEVKRASGDGG